MRRSRALLTVALALLALAALLAGVAGTSRSYPTDGPLQPGGGAGVEFPLPVPLATLAAGGPRGIRSSTLPRGR